MQKRELRRAVFGDESCIGRLPWLNTAMLVYVGVTVVSFVLLQIAPVLTWMVKTPLYHISTYLGLIGAVLMRWICSPTGASGEVSGAGCCMAWPLWMSSPPCVPCATA